jgi:hypothetical protein
MMPVPKANRKSKRARKQLRIEWEVVPSNHAKELIAETIWFILNDHEIKNELAPDLEGDDQGDSCD